jgi:predicted kinase
MIHCLIGIPASGKGTYAKKLKEKIGDKSIIVNRDKIREMLFGYSEATVHEYYHNENIHVFEKQVTFTQKTLIETYLKMGFEVIVDNTHVKEKYINELKNFNVPIKFHVIECDVDYAIYCDSVRTRKVGKDVIVSMYASLKNLMSYYKFDDWFPETYPSITNDQSKKKAVIFDIDGTLAKMTDRGPFEWHRVGEDELREAVYEAYKAHKTLGNTIIICTGRDGSCEEETKDWLSCHNIVYDEFYIRKKNDSRKDYIVKHEMWSEICKNYHVVAMYDDRDQVVNHGRKLGFDIFQVNYGNF